VGCAIAIGLALVLKLVACTGQYALGYFAGNYMQIQKFVGADTKATRAIAKIMNGPFSLGKVAVLIGGPDWPTSVTCGILKVNLVKVLLATCPVVVTAAPCVLAGAYLSKVAPGDTRSPDALFANFFTLAAAVLQLGSMLAAMYYIKTTYEEDKTLEEPPTEARQKDIYEKVTMLRKEDEASDTAYNNVLKKTRGCWLYVIGLAAILTFLSNAVFTSGFAFENFTVSGNIDDDLDKYGLGGNPLNIVKMPGQIALAMFSVSVILHLSFVWRMTCEAARPADVLLE